jgi:Tol biopolymer transport system component
MSKNRGTWAFWGATLLGCGTRAITFENTNGLGSSTTTGPVTTSTVTGPPSSSTTGSTGSGGSGCAGPLHSKDLWVAFDSDAAGSNRDLYVMRPDGSQLQPLTSDPSNEVEPAFSPDGRSIAFASDRANLTWQVYVLQLEGRVVSTVTSRAGGARRPAFSPDGTRIAFRSGLSVYTVALDGTDERLLATAPWDSTFGGPTYTTDGQWIVYDNYNTIRAVHPDGTGDRAIVPATTAEQSHPTVSPDGLSVALQVTCGETDLSGHALRSLWIVPMNGVDDLACRTGRRVTEQGKPSCLDPSWAPQSILGDQQLAWDMGDDQGDIVSLGAPRAGPGDDRNPVWSPLCPKLP